MSSEQPSAETEYYLGVDIGGTFTDLVLTSSDGQVEAAKIPTTTQSPETAVAAGIEILLRQAGAKAHRVRRVVHATTLATNLILERRGNPVAYVTTAGFRDQVALGRHNRTGAERYVLSPTRPQAPIDDELVFEVSERVLPDGTVRSPLDEAGAADVVRTLAERRPAAVAVCLLHSYANPQHEQRLGALLRAALPDSHVTLSSEVWPEFREYERAMTTIISAYVGPLLERYLQALAGELRRLGITAPLQVMQSNGGIVAAETIGRRAVYAVESGPAAGVIAAAELGKRYGEVNVISFDMGGTTAKAGLVRDGAPVVTHEFRVGSHVSVGGRRASGFPVRIPVIDLAEVGSGGGSIAWVDDGGILQVGPQSAGSEPGPACFGRGGDVPTVTDADLVLGYIDPSTYAAGRVPLSVEHAAEAIRKHVAEPLGLGVVEAAHGIYQIVNANMAAAVRVVTVERGIDPRNFTVFAFGGAGPVHIVGLVEEFSIPRIVIPGLAGLASATGLLVSDITLDRVQTIVRGATETSPDEVEAIFDQLARSGCAELTAQGVDPALIRESRSLDVRFTFQSHPLTVPIPTERFTAASLEAVRPAFQKAFHEAFGIDRSAEVELVNARVQLSASVVHSEPSREALQSGDGSAARYGQRPVYFASSGGFVETPVYERDRLKAGEGLAGPAIVASPDTTVVVPPRYRVSVDELRNIVVTAA